MAERRWRVAACARYSNRCAELGRLIVNGKLCGAMIQLLNPALDDFGHETLEMIWRHTRACGMCSKGRRHAMLHWTEVDG